ncbi:alpha/beta fold hydrolase [Arthrobacter sp. TS-15]|uniref:alpha/beta fold hydrolase n=1 Tax=Arthrobacter sp. TS-15 TaxID=2510797 RepID=UPI00115F076D|nr:alpha/beta hydrolase [Arthrobacter sp. TS-15]TQS88949.1 alpha/beta fold hydrolase [Arthrobacter sp. TS-15]
MSDYTTKHLETNGYRTEYLDAGSGDEVVVLLHGGGPGANAETNWRNFIPGLADRYRVIAPDIYGFGNTEHPEQPPVSLTEWMRARVNQVLALLDGLGVERAHLVGNSAGGALAMWTAGTAPERIGQLVLMGTAGGQMAVPTPEVVRMASFYKDPSKAGLEALTRWFVYDDATLGVDVAQIVEDRHKELSRPEVRRSFASMYTPPSSPAEMTVPPSALRRIQQRVLLVHGREDRFVTPDSSVYLNQHIPNSQLHILENCGHWVQIEKRDEMLYLVRGFLDGSY